METVVLTPATDCSSARWPNTESKLWEVLSDPQTGKAKSEPVKLTNWDRIFPISISASRDGSRLSLAKVRIRDDVYLAELADEGRRFGNVRLLSTSDSTDFADVWSRDSGTIFLESNRTGRNEIFRQKIQESSSEPLIGGLDPHGNAMQAPARTGT